LGLRPRPHHSVPHTSQLLLRGKGGKGKERRKGRKGKGE